VPIGVLLADHWRFVGERRGCEG
jgi:hypothetical protein